MSLAPLFSAPLIIQLHAYAAFAAFALGLLQFARAKGDGTHRRSGWIWVALMAGLAGSSFFIHEIRLVGPWSPIHLLAVYVLVQLPFAVFAARGNRIQAHRRAMTGLFVGALVVAGLFTFLPGRILHQVVFGG
ncbi:DUF2306 domain-containing protein [Breoghania sp. L-A4]|uniref:DUF2306 domain-containing protein n=1 Tax=Breoghania sp. L-A4 TaxID=2304600 RepID=UPI000E35A7AC|nr:DUF2306 domain-containing protein [Breoghania sp. L-A4]AXS40551.1 DUF2306 domain-containing protein [Breoghania sp. L-A4]